MKDNAVKLAWNEDTTTALVDLAGDMGVEITQERVSTIAQTLSEQFSDEGTEREATPRSVGAKLRKLGYEVQKASEVSRVTWSDEDEQDLQDFVNANEGLYTYAEIAEQVCGGRYSRAQVQGKILHLELFDKVKATPKSAPARKFTDEEEEIIVNMVTAGDFVEDIAKAIGKSTRQIHGKCLSLLKEARITDIPVLREKKEAVRADIFDGVDVANMTVEEIAASTKRSTRGIKSALSRRGLDCLDHKGSERRAKLDAKAAKAE